jgi:hypothetical protein
VDDATFEGPISDDELEQVRRELARLGQESLPPGVATRLDARLAAELSATPLAARRAGRRLVGIGATLTAAAAIAAAAVFALGTGGGSRQAPEAAALRSSTVAAAAAAPADSAAKAPTGAKTAAGASSASPAAACPPASRTGGGRPRAACPGARGGHARAV